MKGRKHTPEQIVRKLPEADRMLGEGKLVAAPEPDRAGALEMSAGN